MHFCAENLRNQTWVTMKLLIMIILWTTIFIKPTTSDPRIQQSALICGKTRPPANVSNIPTFVQEMENLSQTLTNKSFATHHLLNSTVPIYALSQCYHDLSHTDCLLCYAASRTTLPRCLPSTAGRIYLDGCFLRYDSYEFYNETVDPVADTVNCNSSVGGGGVGPEFEKDLAVLVANVTEMAVKNGGFGVLEVKGVFGLGQCWETVSKDGCRECLGNAGKQVMEKCLPGSKEGRGLNAGCYFRYSTHKFYEDSAQNNTNNGNSGVSRAGITVAIILSAMAFLLIILFAAYAAYQRLSKRKEERCITSHLSSSLARLNFKYETLEKATNYFDLSRKVGQGGAGSVYKGTLPNGETVAVKRLFYNTKQWVDEFFNEVNLISGIEHKNLVKLLGCSIEGPESLLVYEYVPNRSLDQFLFEKEKIQILNWNQRFEIIVGIAEGLAYLHGGCHIRIIHRDIKSSNILLDENLAPKISDFGLARHFGTDKSHLSTGIAGTLGYMAPEYIVRGQLTEKADVYSFGVLVIEIICGRRNNAFVEDSGSLLQTVWRLHKEGKAEESVDHWLKGEFPVRHASRVLQIGLLCTQALAALRPSMDEVVNMLKDQEDGELPSPNQPPFLNARALNSSTGTSRGLSSSLTSSAMTKLDVSYTTSEYSSSHSSERLLRNEDPVDIV